MYEGEKAIEKISLEDGRVLNQFDGEFLCYSPTSSILVLWSVEKEKNELQIKYFDTVSGASIEQPQAFGSSVLYFIPTLYTLFSQKFDSECNLLIDLGGAVVYAGPSTGFVPQSLPISWPASFLAVGSEYMTFRVGDTKIITMNKKSMKISSSINELPLFSVTQAVASPDGRYFSLHYTGLNEFIIWDARSGDKVLQQDDIKLLGFSPDSRLAITADEYQATIWDLESRKPTVHFSGYEFVSAIFILDQKYVITKHRNGSIRIWSAHTGALVHAI